MKPFLRLFFIMAALLLMPYSLAAQKTDKTFCGELSKTDCALLTDSETVMKNINSHSFKLDTTVDITGLPNMPDKLSLHLTGSGSLIVDRKAMPDTSKLDPATFSKDPKAVFDLISKAVSSVSADVQFAFEIPKEILPVFGGKKMPDTVDLNLKVVDGTVYLNMAKLAPIFDAAKTMPEWTGINIPDVLTAMLKQPGFGTSMNSMSTGMNMGMSADMMALFSDQKVLADFIHIKRLADDTVGSTKVAVYETTLDYPAMFAMPAMQKMISDQMAKANPKLSDKEMKAAMLMVQALGKGMTFTMTKRIDLEKHYLLDTQANLKMDMSSMKQQMGSAMVFNLTLDVTQNDFNTVADITAPKGGVVIPAASLFPKK